MTFEWPSWVDPLPFPFPELHNFPAQFFVFCISMCSSTNNTRNKWTSKGHHVTGQMVRSCCTSASSFISLPGRGCRLEMITLMSIYFNINSFCQCAYVFCFRYIGRWELVFAAAGDASFMWPGSWLLLLGSHTGVCCIIDHVQWLSSHKIHSIPWSE